MDNKQELPNGGKEGGQGLLAAAASPALRCGRH